MSLGKGDADGVGVAVDKVVAAGLLPVEKLVQPLLAGILQRQAEYLQQRLVHFLGRNDHHIDAGETALLLDILIFFRSDLPVFAAVVEHLAKIHVPGILIGAGQSLRIPASGEEQAVQLFHHRFVQGTALIIGGMYGSAVCTGKDDHSGQYHRRRQPQGMQHRRTDALSQHTLQHQHRGDQHHGHQNRGEKKPTGHLSTSVFRNMATARCCLGSCLCCKRIVMPEAYIVNRKISGRTFQGA